MQVYVAESGGFQPGSCRAPRGAVRAGLVSRGCMPVCGADAETGGEAGRGLCSPDLSIHREGGWLAGIRRASPPPRGVQADVARARWGRQGRAGGQGARGPSRPRARDAGAAGCGRRGPAEARGLRPERGRVPGAAPAAGARRSGKPGPSACSPLTSEVC